MIFCRAYGPSLHVKTCLNPHDPTSLSASFLDFDIILIMRTCKVRQYQDATNKLGLRKFLRWFLSSVATRDVNVMCELEVM